jgi:hypothetical protein
MKRFSLLPLLLGCLVSALLPTPAASQTTKISGIPATNVLNAADVAILNSSVGGGNFATRTMTMLQFFSLANSLLPTIHTNFQQFLSPSNKVIATMWGVPTNTSNGLGTIFSSAQNVFLLSNTTAAANFILPGTQIQFPPAFGNGQAWVDGIIDQTHLLIHPWGFNVAAGTWTNYPPLQVWTDINGVIQGGVESDGTIFTMCGGIGGPGTGTFGNETGGGLILEDGLSSIKVSMLSADGAGPLYGESFMLYSINRPGGQIMVVSAAAPNYSFGILQNGAASFENSITNDTGAPVTIEMAQFPQGSTNGGGIYLPGSNTITPAGTISGTNGYALLGASSYNFNPNMIGEHISVGGADYTITGMPFPFGNPHLVTTFPVVLSAPTGASFTLEQNTLTSADATGGGSFNASAAISQTGEIVATGAVNNSGQGILIADGTNSVRINTVLQVEGPRLEFQNLLTHAMLALNQFAPGDSLAVKADGEVSMPNGITNANGSTVPINLPVVIAGTAKATGLITTLTNWGTITATGWTNTTGMNAVVSIAGTGNLIWKNNAGATWTTNGAQSSGLMYPPMQPGEAFTGSGLSGTWKIL